ncbi:hypothetical protein J2Z40_002515 [Cytobacillus eiseniae]|uniref:Uncharacterized protein n=1 Tax=Cytobacillus eiseniae TaxID=762947 RepID=A0ABS4RGB6_9BACI|nr:hypothetical protein [Cytobacillus eiseniae]
MMADKISSKRLNIAEKLRFSRSIAIFFGRM